MKVILLTIAGTLSVREGHERLGISRTRFQDVRTQMLAGACEALGARPAGRPPRTARVDEELEDLRHEVRRLRRRLVEVQVHRELAEAGLTPVLLGRLARRGGGK
ncbi:MAG: hypothetical protein R3263_02440 [Myxococcota bacterium]|nr:hypothetical protein [Myxococcota bacterium]